MNKIFIKKVRIDNLWNRYNIDWNLHEGVNILIGKNGTGKSTILDIIEAIILDKENLIKKYSFSSIEILFSNQTGIKIQHNKHKISDEYDKDEILKMLELLKADILTKVIDSKTLDSKTLDSKTLDSKTLDSKSTDNKKLNFPEIIKISTFDMELQNKKAIKNYGNKKEIQTELDLILDNLINEFKLFQLKLKNKVEEESIKIDEKIKNLTNSSTNNNNELLNLKRLVQEKEEKIKLIFEYKDKFKNIINKLFSSTGKVLTLDENNSIVFDFEDTIISPYQLSSGEKQILMIFLTVILKENHKFILLMDEPEISLHVEWQKDFLNSLVNLNPNMQIILATHSPAIVTKGWKDKVVKISDIISKV